MSPIVTSDGYSWERKELHLSRVIFVLGAMLSFSASFNLKNLALCVSSLRRVHAKILQTMTTLLELCVSARAGTMNSLLNRNWTMNYLLKKKKTALLGFVPCAETTLIFTASPQKKLDYTAGLLLDIRTFGRAVECTSVSPLTNAMGGLSG